MTDLTDYTGYLVDDSGRVWLHLASDQAGLAGTIRDESGTDHHPEDVSGPLYPIERTDVRITPEVHERLDRWWIQSVLADVTGALNAAASNTGSAKIREIKSDADDGELLQAIEGIRAERARLTEVSDLLGQAEAAATHLVDQWTEEVVIACCERD